MSKRLEFIKKLILISLPIIVMQLFLNIASLLDTVMVGQLDETNVSGVYIGTQVIFVANLLLFGSTEGSSVFFSQFYGNGDKKRMRSCFNMKIIMGMATAFIEMIVIYLFGRNLAGLFTNNAMEIDVAVSYMNIVASSLIMYSVSVAISSTLREIHHTLPPMVISLLAAMANFCINYLLIFGKMGAPRLEGAGAAYGTLANRAVEMLMYIGFILMKKYDFINGFFGNFKIESKLFVDILKKSIPLMLNEGFWSLNQTMLVFVFTKSDSLATTVLPIVQTVFNLAFVTVIGLANGIGIMIGNTIGEGENERAQREAYDSIFTSIAMCLILGIVLFSTSNIITSVYKGVSPEAREYASFFLRFTAFNMVVQGLNCSMFFLLRAGGKTLIVFFFDSVYGWVISVPLACLFVFAFHMEFKALYIAVYSVDLIKTVIGLTLIMKKKWHNNLTTSVQAS